MLGLLTFSWKSLWTSSTAFDSQYHFIKRTMTKYWKGGCVLRNKSPHTLVENPEMNHLTFFTSLDWNPNCIRQCNYVTVEEFNPVKMLIDEIIMINVAAAGDVGSLYKYVAADLPSLALLGSLVSQLWRAAAGWTAPMSQLL